MQSTTIEFLDQTIETKKCDCGEEKIIADSVTGETICQSCGCVLGINNISFRPERRTFSFEEHLQRSRVEVLDPTMGTLIGGKKVTATINRLKKQQRTINRSKEDRSMARAKIYLQRIIGKLCLPRIVKETTIVIHKMAIDQGLSHRKNPESFAAALIYLSCKTVGIPRGIAELANITGRPKKEISKYFRMLKKNLQSQIDEKFGAKTQTASYFQSIEKITDGLKASMSTTLLSFKIMKIAQERKITHGMSPRGMSAAVIYIASILNNEPLNQKDIATRAYTTMVTLRSRSKELIQKLNFEISL